MDVGENLTDAEDQPRKEESKDFQRSTDNKFCRSLDEHKNMFKMNKVVSDISRTAGGSVSRPTKMSCHCIEKPTFSWGSSSTCSLNRGCLWMWPQPFWLRSWWVIHGGLSQVVPAVCLSGVRGGISMSRVSATLRKALSVRAVQIALRGPRLEEQKRSPRTDEGDATQNVGRLETFEAGGPVAVEKPLGR